MERGSSVPWQQTLQEAIGEDRLDASALREYFRPLEDWLRTENLRTGDVVGWSYGEKAIFLNDFYYPPVYSSSFRLHVQIHRAATLNTLRKPASRLRNTLDYRN